MARFDLSLAALILTLMPTIAYGQSVWQDDGLVWVGLTLIDMDAPGGPTPLQDPFVEPCHHNSPRALSDWMPHGFRQDRVTRELVEGDCERVVPLRVRGVLDWTPVSLMLPWQPGADGEREIGIPRTGAGHLRLRLPDVLIVGAQAYHAPDPIIVSLGGSERSTSAVVMLRRLARAIIFEPADVVATDRHTIPYNVDTRFLLPGERLLQTDEAHRLNVIAIDPRGRRHDLTDPRAPSRFVNLSAGYGWIFEVEVLPRTRAHRDWVASLKSPSK